MATRPEWYWEYVVNNLTAPKLAAFMSIMMTDFNQALGNPVGFEQAVGLVLNDGETSLHQYKIGDKKFEVVIRDVTNES